MRLALVQDAQEQNPGQLRDVIHGARHVRAAHDVANGLHRRIQRLRGGVSLVGSIGAEVARSSSGLRAVFVIPAECRGLFVCRKH